MKKAVYSVSKAYIFDPNHKGAPYSLNGGENWTNRGELCEIELKAALGYMAVKDACGAYDTTDDIPELNMSVKSSNATLVNKPLGYDFNSFKAHYFATCHSSAWVWVTVIDDEVIAYYMDREEFESFMDAWATFTKDRKVIRFKKESGIMRAWLDERAE